MNEDVSPNKNEIFQCHVSFQGCTHIGGIPYDSSTRVWILRGDFHPLGFQHHMWWNSQSGGTWMSCWKLGSMVRISGL